MARVPLIGSPWADQRELRICFPKRSLGRARAAARRNAATAAGRLFSGPSCALRGAASMDAATRAHIDKGHARLAHYITRLANEPSVGLCAFSTARPGGIGLMSAGGTYRITSIAPCRSSLRPRYSSRLDHA